MPPNSGAIHLGCRPGVLQSGHPTLAEPCSRQPPRHNAFSVTRLIRTIDAHVGGCAVRLIVDGVASGTGRSLGSRTERFARQSDQIRRALVRPPRGHDDLTAVLLTEPITPGAHAAIICMDSGGYPSLHGDAVIAAATIAIERRLIVTDQAGGEIRLNFDTSAGAVTASVRVEQRGDALHVDSVALTGVPAFVYAAAQPVRAASRDLRVDIAFGGLFHAIVDTEAIGIPLDHGRLPELRRLAIEVLKALNGSIKVQHPADAAIAGVAALTITSAPRDPEAHLRNVTITVAGAINPSAGVTGTAAAMAVLDAMGLLPEGQPFIHEGMAGSLLRGRLARRTQVDELPAIVTEITGSAWITGEHMFVLDDDDPFRDGYGL
jgi:proline racemase